MPSRGCSGVSTFRQDIEVTCDGEVFKCQSKAIDFTNAERALVRDGGQVDKDQMALRFRIAYTVLRRCHPESPYSSAYGVFLDALDDIHEEGMNDGDEGDPMDPTPEVGSGTSP
jgi:hypothetical protein